ncbi:MAG: DUF4296 domain-containing protein [Daejeonella sp.]
MNRIILFLFTTILLSACNQNDTTPKGVIDPQKMTAVLTDIHLVDGYISSSPQTDTLVQNNSVLYQNVYKKYHINKSQFDKSIKYYSAKPVLLDSIYSKVLLALEKKEKQEQKKTIKKNNDLPQ